MKKKEKEAKKEGEERKKKKEDDDDDEKKKKRERVHADDTQCIVYIRALFTQGKSYEHLRWTTWFVLGSPFAVYSSEYPPENLST
jgi:hypothetical protein